MVNHRDGEACRTCRGVFKGTGNLVCMKCGKPLESGTREYCGDCNKREHVFVRNYAMWLYDSKMQSSIAYFKYHGRREYSLYYAQEICKRFGGQLRSLSIDAIVPVPLFIKKKKSRGYNQAEVLARELGGILGLRVYPDLLIRVKNTKPQKELDDFGRSRNLNDAFDYNEKWVKKQKDIPGIKRVLLVDDIYTTGSTLDACSKVLMKNGILAVYGLTVSIGSSGGKG